MLINNEFSFNYDKTDELLICNISYLGGDNYSIHLYNSKNLEPENEIFSTWVDSNGGEIEGNKEIYKYGYDEAIYICYDLFNTLQSFLING